MITLVPFSLIGVVLLASLIKSTLYGYPYWQRWRARRKLLKLVNHMRDEGIGDKLPEIVKILDGWK